MNGDNRPDLVTANASSNTVSVLLNITGVPTSPPLAPTIIPNATASNTSATVSWQVPAWDGGSAIIGYVVTPYVGYVSQGPRYFQSTATTQTVPGLTNGTTYRFRVRAWNAIGVSGFSKVTNAVTPATTAPGQPTIGTAVAGDGEAAVSWTAPASDGGSAIIGYVVTPYVGYVSQGPRYFQSTATTQTVPGLTNGTTYRFRVRAWNAIGVSGFSKVTNPVTPTA